jgi:subtilase family serine protease
VDAIRVGRRGACFLATFGLLAVLGGGAVPIASAASADSPQVQQRGPQVDRSGPGFNEHREFRGNAEHVDVNVCSTAVGPMEAHCNSRVRTDTEARTARPARAAQAQPAGTLGNNGAYDPSYLESAYNITTLISSGAGRGQVVALVDAYDDPNISADLSSYRGYFGLPALPDCTTWPSTTPCFNKVNQVGARGSYPAPDSSWSEEIALDVEMVSAICPNCSIVLVEANSNTYGDLMAAVTEAVALGANVVSNSYGSGEWSGETGPGMDSVFNHPGVAFTASTGDAGYGVEWPAASMYVTAVGGTSLNQATNTGTRNATETAWAGAGSGCSAFEPKPAWQTDAACAMRTVADVSAVADPSTGVWIYDTYGGAGWNILGGTSVAAPIVGSVYALAGNSLSTSVQLNGDPYSHTTALFDASGGSNGSCGGTYLCTGVVGYDGPTGLGTPNGSAAFANMVAAPVADFSLSASNTNITVTRGGTRVSDTLTLSAINGYHNAVQLSVSGLPSGVNANLSTTSVTPTGSATLTFKAGWSAVSGTSRLATVTAKGADGTLHTIGITVNVR